MFVSMEEKMDNKPSWDDAPEWANYLAENGNSFWYWHQNKPEKNTYDKEWLNSGRSQIACDKNWENTLEKRPK